MGRSESKDKSPLKSVFLFGVRDYARSYAIQCDYARMNANLCDFMQFCENQALKIGESHIIAANLTARCVLWAHKLRLSSPNT